MHCSINITDSASFPKALRPVKGRAVIDYLITDALSQREITSISIISNPQSFALIQKHIKNAFPEVQIEVTTKPFENDKEDDVLILDGAAYTSLKLQDFIRFFRQYKTLVKAAFDKQNPKEIPFTIIPKGDAMGETHIFNCGTGFCDL